ncbi:MAG TPA: cytochrome ubiquinol oxidase subunit I [Gemmatimonadaceae bacterium]|jgi:cytochrome d ubiquinol oxidase subunit I|nr:cytochrome ubiquinol oxidase subunit I [Gemmatimonadaceae bacterium]
MSNLFAARTQMALSLGFHIVFAEIGIAMPLMMAIAEWRWHRTKNEVYLELAKRWAKGSAILFAVGAVSGTVLSFELGLLWPGFMKQAGPVIGIPFSLEGFAFFTEAIFLGVYLYGWGRIAPPKHIAAGLVVAASGAASAVFVVMVNAWMNTPAGVSVVQPAVGGLPQIVVRDPIAGMLNPSTLQQSIHMVLAAYAATGFAVAGVHAGLLIRGRNIVFHRAALRIALLVGAPAAILQPVSGDFSARTVARWQPVKLAALEGQFETERGAPLRIGGWPDATARRTRGALEIPYGLSLLAFHDPRAEVKGLTDFPRSDWPPLPPVHVGFQTMVALGTLMALVSLWTAITVVRRRDIAKERWLLRALAIVTPFGFIATEAGWTVTEVGRQPWVVQGIVRTSDAVTPMAGLVVPMSSFAVLYVGLAVMVVWLLRSMMRATS